MTKLLNTKTGRLRLIAFLEGLSLLALVLIAVPLKYLADDPYWVGALGPIHGALFLLFVLNTFSVSLEQKWPFATTAKVLAACFIPFGTFYIDHKILKPIKTIPA